MFLASCQKPALAIDRIRAQTLSACCPELSVFAYMKQDNEKKKLNGLFVPCCQGVHSKVNIRSATGFNKQASAALALCPLAWSCLQSRTILHSHNAHTLLLGQADLGEGHALPCVLRLGSGHAWWWAQWQAQWQALGWSPSGAGSAVGWGAGNLGGRPAAGCSGIGFLPLPLLLLPPRLLGWLPHGLAQVSPEESNSGDDDNKGNKDREPPATSNVSHQMTVDYLWKQKLV